MTNKNTRIEYIDIAKGIGIILVVLGHTLNQHKLPCLYIRSFHMPLFFFISGLCFSFDKYNSSVTFINKRYRQIIIPLINFLLLSILVSISITPQYYPPELLFQRMPGAMWFLLVLFIVEIIYFFFGKYAKNIYAIITFLIINAFIGILLHREKISLPYNISTVFISVFYYGTGNISRRYDMQKIYKCLCLPLLLLPLILVTFTHDTLDLVDNYIPSCEAIYILASFSGLTGIIIFSVYLQDINHRYTKNILLYFGKNTLIILCLHTIFINLTNIYIHKYISSQTTYLLLQQIVVWISCYISIRIINSYLPFMLGKKSIKK